MSQTSWFQAGRFLDNLTNATARFEGRTLEEVKGDLRAEGADPEEAVVRFLGILSEHAPTWKERTERERRQAQELIQETRPKGRLSHTQLIEEITGILAFMQSQGAPVVSGAYYRKFKEATTEDLESLLEDLRIQRDLLKQKGETNNKSDG